MGLLWEYVHQPIGGIVLCLVISHFFRTSQASDTARDIRDRFFCCQSSCCDSPAKIGQSIFFVLEDARLVQ
jgi:hypothetical protein